MPAPPFRTAALKESLIKTHAYMSAARVDENIIKIQHESPALRNIKTKVSTPLQAYTFAITLPLTRLLFAI